MSTWRVYAYITQSITIYVSAKNEDQALGRARERLAVDIDPCHIRNVSQPDEVTERDIAHAAKIGLSPYEGDFLRGRPLTADEKAYCEGRGYDVSYDTDAFPGIQWTHIADDSVALCRTTALWGGGAGLDHVSCPFCSSILRDEMRYNPLPLMIYRRQTGQRAIAKVEYRGGTADLLVNGVVVRSEARTEGLGPNDLDWDWDRRYRELEDIADKLNLAGPAEVQRPRVKWPTDGDVGRIRAVTLLRLLRNAEEEPDMAGQLADIRARYEAHMGTLTPEERKDVERYFGENHL